MSLTLADKRYLRAMVRSEIQKVIMEASEQQVGPTQGGYDGATEFKEDEWSEDSRRVVVGFHAPAVAER